jgi:hypothetical protein
VVVVGDGVGPPVGGLVVDPAEHYCSKVLKGQNIESVLQTNL